MGLELDYSHGQTPLDEEEKEGLLIKGITTKNELNEFEQQNIEDAVMWSMVRNFTKDAILSEAFVREVHRRMFGNVWAWAGTFRKTNKNLGVDRWQISIGLKNLQDDAFYWINEKVYPPDEIAVRFKHRIVSIHCFSNGNGRHSRLMADIIAEKIFQLPVFTWGAGISGNGTDSRTAYLKALKTADKGNYGPLIKFARS